MSATLIPLYFIRKQLQFIPLSKLLPLTGLICLQKSWSGDASGSVHHFSNSKVSPASTFLAGPRANANITRRKCLHDGRNMFTLTMSEDEWSPLAVVARGNGDVASVSILHGHCSTAVYRRVTHVNPAVHVLPLIFRVR